jgi:hydrogenase expression/formation protein HypE
LATSLNEIAQQSGVGIQIDEPKIPIKDGVWGACEMLGFDPLYVANEGKLITIVGPKDAEKILSVMRETKYGEGAAIIGEVVAEPQGKVLMKTTIGGTRIVHMLVGEMLPRIC